MEMEKAFYVVTCKPAYLDLLRATGSRIEPQAEEFSESGTQRTVVGITQGGFGQDVIDDERQTKERFLEYLFFSSGIDLPRTADVFDQYFVLDPVDEIVDLDEEL